MYDFINSSIGWFHLIAALVSLATGSFVLLTTKGTEIHKKVGYLYGFSMILVCGTAFGIYNLTGTFGIFHILACVALATLMGGMIPLFLKNIQKGYKVFHLWFMYYSVLGLYAAFASELIVRIPEKPFYPMVGMATGVIFLIGTVFIFWKERKWRHFFPD